MRVIVYRQDANGNERWQEYRIPEPLDSARLVVTLDGVETDYDEIGVIDQTWEPRG